MARSALPRIPSATWHAHPAWQAQAYPALVGFHDRYRREMARLVAAAADASESLGDVSAACTRLKEMLHAHEAVEEQGLYPWIEAHHEVVLRALTQEHAELNRRLDGVVELLSEPDVSRPRLRALLAELDRTLRVHLDAEEAICVPALLAMSAEDFARLTGD